MVQRPSLALIETKRITVWAATTRTTKKKNNNGEENGGVQVVNFGPVKQGRRVSYRAMARGTAIPALCPGSKLSRGGVQLLNPQT